MILIVMDQIIQRSMEMTQTQQIQTQTTTASMTGMRQITEQIQNRLGLTWYPSGNLNLYAGGYLNSQYEMSDSGSVIRIIPELLVGIGIAEKVWLEINGAVGEMSNYLEQNGSIVYNSFSDVIQKKVSLSVSVPIADKGSLLYLGGRWTSNQSGFYPFDPAQNEITNYITYNTLSIYGGVSWKF